MKDKGDLWWGSERIVEEKAQIFELFEEMTASGIIL
jgi:hypothetical protein